MKNVFGAILAGLGIGAIGAGVGVGAVILLIIGILLKPLFAILIGWVIGFGLKFIAGTFVAGALSTIFHTTITVSALPQIFAGISLLASFIRPIVNTNKAIEVEADKKKLKKEWNELKKEFRTSK